MSSAVSTNREIVRLKIGGLALELKISDGESRTQVERRYSDFITHVEPDLSAIVTIETATTKLSLQDLPIIFRDGVLAYDYPDCHLHIDLEGQRAELRLSCSQPLWQLEYFIRLVYALLAYEAGGLLLHASGLVRQGAAYGFFGYSGSGKSTVVRFSAGCNVLSDDLLILLPDATGWRAHATPFWNADAHPPVAPSAPLAGLMRLVQDQHVFLERLDDPLAMAELLASSPVVSADPGRSAGLLQRCRDIVRSVPVCRLHFLPDGSFWQVITAEI